MRLFICIALVQLVTQLTPNAIAHGASPDSVVRIALKNSAHVPNSIVRLGQIAAVEGGSDWLREKIIDLDVTDPPTSNRPAAVSQTQVDIRLMLAGIPDHAFEVEGAARVDVRLKRRELSDESILTPTRQTIADYYNVGIDDLDIRLTQPMRNLPVISEDAKDVDIRILLPLKVQTGPMLVRAAINVDGRLAEMVFVSIELRMYHEVARVKKSMASNEPFSITNVEFVRLPLAGNGLKDLAGNLGGKVAKRALTASTVLYEKDIADPFVPEIDYVVKPRSPVRLVARQGGLMVTILNAQALDRGRIGDTIRVKNMDSGTILSGRVVSANEIAISL